MGCCLSSTTHLSMQPCRCLPVVPHSHPHPSLPKLWPQIYASRDRCGRDFASAAMPHDMAVREAEDATGAAAAAAAAAGTSLPSSSGDTHMEGGGTKKKRARDEVGAGGRACA